MCQMRLEPAVEGRLPRAAPGALRFGGMIPRRARRVKPRASACRRMRAAYVRRSSAHIRQSRAHTRQSMAYMRHSMVLPFERNEHILVYVNGKIVPREEAKVHV